MIQETQSKLETTILPGKHTFYFSKINVHEKIELDSSEVTKIIHEEIPRVIENAQEMKLGNNTISFTDIYKGAYEDNTFIKGNLTSSKIEKMRIKKGSSTFYSNSENEIANSAMFIYFIESEILVFETISKINHEKFINLFTRLLSSDEKVGKVIINILPEKFKLIEELTLFDVVTSIEFNLIHPNPRSFFHNRYDEMVRESGAKKVDIKLTDTEDGLDLKLDEDNNTENKTIKDGIQLVEAGYGSSKFNGKNISYIDGKRPNTRKKVVKSRKFDSSKSHKSLVFNGEFQYDIITKVATYIKEHIL